MSKEDLIDQVMELQRQLNSIPRPPVLSEEQVKEKAEKARKMMVSGIKKQMKWTPSCKFGNARFTYEGHVSPKETLLQLFNPPPDHKKKMLQFDIGEFEDKVAEDSIRTSVRYSFLRLQGKHVNVRISLEEGTFKVSGTYGKM